MQKSESSGGDRKQGEPEPQPPVSPACPACGGRVVEIRGKLVCARCRTICETCCEGGRG
jgi:hypothetical protein